MINTVIETYAKYYMDSDTVRSDTAWSQGITDELSITQEDGPPKFSPGTIKGKPAFEDGVLESLGMPAFKTWRRLGGTMVAQSKNWTAIIPGGFRGGETPNKMNPISFEIGEYSALMGLIHVIAIPNQRLTNCVAVMEEDVPLIMEGIQLLDTAFSLLASGGAEEVGSVRWQLSQMGTITMKDGSEKSARVTENDFTDDCKDNFRKLVRVAEVNDDSFLQQTSNMDMEVTCHADTMSSIRKLHLHGFSADYKTVAWSKMETKAEEEHHQVKNTPIEQVIYMANSGKARQMRDNALSGSRIPQPQPEPEPEPEPEQDSMLERQNSIAGQDEASMSLSRQSSRPTGH